MINEKNVYKNYYFCAYTQQTYGKKYEHENKKIVVFI